MKLTNLFHANFVSFFSFFTYCIIIVGTSEYDGTVVHVICKSVIFILLNILIFSNFVLGGFFTSPRLRHIRK